MKTIFICRQNIGRSQIAQVLYEKYTNSISQSYGTIVDNDLQLVVHCLDRDFLPKIMDFYDCDISSLRRNQLNLDSLNGVEKIIVMAEKDTWPDFLKSDYRVEFWNIEDPINASYNNYASIVHSIDLKVKELIEKEKS